MYQVRHYHLNPAHNTTHDCDDVDDVISALNLYGADEANEGCSVFEINKSEVMRRDWASEKLSLADVVKVLPVTVRAWDDGSSATAMAEYGDDYEDAARDLWDDADYGDGDWRVEVGWTATDAAGNEIARGSFELTHQTEEPDCPEGDEHDWTSEHEGGCDENPGVWSTGGTSMLFVSRCRHCGMERREHTTGSQRNPGECDTVTYSEPDADWVAEHSEGE